MLVLDSSTYLSCMCDCFNILRIMIREFATGCSPLFAHGSNIQYFTFYRCPFRFKTFRIPVSTINIYLIQNKYFGISPWKSNLPSPSIKRIHGITWSLTISNTIPVRSSNVKSLPSNTTNSDSSIPRSFSV